MKATNETKADFADAIAAIRAAADQNPEYPGKIKDIQRGKPEDRAVFRIPAPHSKGVIVSCEPWRQCINALADKLEKNARFFGGVRPTLKVSKVGDARGLTAARSAHAEGHHRAAARALGDRLIFTVRAERNPTFQPYCKSATCEVSGVEYSIGFAVFGTRKTMLVIHEPTGMFISARSIGNPRTEAEAIAAMQSDDHAEKMALIADALAAGKHPDFDQASELAEYLEADTLETLSPEPIAEPEAAESTVTEGEHSAESFGYLEEMPCAPFQAPRRPAIEGYPTETIAAIVDASEPESVTAAAPDESESIAAPLSDDALLAALGVAAPALDPAALYAKAGAVLGTPKKSRATKASEPKTRVYQCYSDPGHGWARVPMSDIIALGIANKITPYSYMRGSWAYLEEDCDASTLVRACEAQGIAVTFKSHATCDRPSSIRNYDSYRSPVPPDAVAAQALETDESDCDDSDCATIAAPVVAQAAAGSIVSATLGHSAAREYMAAHGMAGANPQTLPAPQNAAPAAPKLRARWNGSTWIQDSPPDDGGNSPPNAGMPTGEAGEGAGEDSPLESITIMRAEGLIDCPVWPAGETRVFRTFESATKGLRDICGSMEKDRPGYDKCDITVQWRNGREYKYRFDATPDMRETPDVAQHIRDTLAFHCGAMRPSQMTREAYARFISDEHNRNWLQSLRDELDGCAFPLPLPDDCEPAPYGELRHGLRCYYKGWGPGGADSSEAIVTHVDERTDKYGYQYFNIITLDNPRVMQFLVSSLTGLRPSVILGDSYASDIETTRLVNAAKAADVQKAIKAADEKAQFSETVERLKAENPRLSKDRSVAQNIRASFKLAGIKASVRKDGHSCINIILADARNLEKAEEIAFRFKAGHFDGMQDCYEYRRTPFTEAFGDVEYIFIN